MMTPNLIAMPEPQGFKEFWQAYPRKEAKLDAKRAYAIAIRKVTPEALIQSVKDHIQSDQWRRGFIPLPATFLNGERWTDTLTSTQPTKLTPIQAQIHSGEYQRAMARMSLLRNQYADHQDWSQRDKEEYRKLKSRCAELRTMLGIII